MWRRRERPRYVVVADTVKVVIVVLFGIYALHILTAGTDEIVARTPPSYGENSVQTQAPKPTKAERMIADKAHCWGGTDQPLVKWPTHAVVKITKTGEVVYTSDPALVSEAFDEALTLAGYGDTVSQHLDPIVLCI